MTWSKGAGAFAGSVIFAPATEKLLEGTSLGTSLFRKLTLGGAAAGGGGNITEQSIDLLNGDQKQFHVNQLFWSTGFGAAGGATGWVGMKIVPTPTYINLPANSLSEDFLKFPAAAGAWPALITQKLVLAPKPAGTR